MIIIDAALLTLVGIGLGVSNWKKTGHVLYATLDGGEGAEDSNERLRAIGMIRGISDTQYAQGAKPVRSLVQRRRASSRVDDMDGNMEDGEPSAREQDIEKDFHRSPDLQRFIQSMAKTIETTSIGLSFDFENLSLAINQRRKILKNLTGTIPRGSCWGIMGGSGAGKTTFLNTLMGKRHSTGGIIKVNGWEKDMAKYKKLIGYVPQDDVLFPELTVRENILHSARCRMTRQWRDKAIQGHVDSLIACLQLTHVQHSRVGDARKPLISGGQRKRVNIGIELASAPMAIFLDEPTSGLDATSASSIMRLLQALSRLGVTVIAIVHQPREQIFAAFDHVLVLARGQSVYSGPIENIQGYFESLGFAFPESGNPADVLIDISMGDGARYAVGARMQDSRVSSLIDAWKKPEHCSATDKRSSMATLDGQSIRSRMISNQSMSSTPEQEESLSRTMRARGATWPAQAFYCFNRAVTQQVRNSTSFLFEVAVGALAGMVIGLSAYTSEGHLFQGMYHSPFTELSPAVDYQSTPQLGLLSGLAIGLAASAPGFCVFGEEKLMYLRETASGHSRSAYYVGKLLSTIPRICLSAFHFTVFLHILATPLISFGSMYMANLMYFWCTYGLASIVSMLVKREDGPLIAVLASLVIGVLGGVAPPLSTVKTWHMEWFWRLSPGVWFTEAYLTENLTPLGYLYQLDLAAETIGYTLRQYNLDIGQVHGFNLDVTGNRTVANNGRQRFVRYRGRLSGDGLSAPDLCESKQIAMRRSRIRAGYHGDHIPPDGHCSHC